MPVTDWVYPDNVWKSDSTGSLSGNWADHNNAAFNDGGAVARFASGAFKTGTSDLIGWWQMGIDGIIPSGATITGVEVAFRCNRNADGFDVWECAIKKTPSIQSTIKNVNDPILNTGYNWYQYGGDGDLWGFSAIEEQYWDTLEFWVQFDDDVNNNQTDEVQLSGGGIRFFYDLPFVEKSQVHLIH